MNVQTTTRKILILGIISALTVIGVTTAILYTREAAEAVNSCPSSLQNPITGLVTIDASTLTGDNIIDCSSYNIQIQSGGTLQITPVIADNDQHTDDYGVVIQALSVTIDEGGLIDLEGEGYGPGVQSAHVGSGKSSVIPCDSGFCGGSGAGHGGAGGRGDPDGSNEAGDPGTAYGTRENPITLGSGGGESGQAVAGGAGGGALKFEVAGSFTLNGTVNANGEAGSQGVDTGGGGGAGGSFWVEAGSFAGTGTVSADGGDGAEPIGSGGWGGGGGGGRVTMRCTTANTFSGTVTADEGAGNANDGQVGTVVGASCYPYDPASLAQYEYIDSDTQNLIADTGSTKYTSMQFRFNVSDVENSSTLTPQIELREVGQAFTDNPTHTGTSVSYSGTPVEAQVLVTGLTKTKEYKWQARSRDNNGVYSDWVEYEEDASEEIDFIVLGNPDTLVQISGDGQSGTVGTQLSNPFIVELQDAVGHPIPDVTITWQIVSGGGNLSNEQSTTDTNGRGQSTLTLGTTAGTDNNAVDAVRTGVTGSPSRFTATANAGPLHHYYIDAPTVALTNTDFDPAVLIEARDQYENFVSSANTTVDLTVDPGTGSLTPVQATLTDGDVTVSNMQYDTVENIKVKADDGTYTGYSDTVIVVAAYGSCFGFANDPGNSPLTLTAAGSPWDFAASAANGGVVNCDQIDLTVEASATVRLYGYDNGNTCNSVDDAGCYDDYGVTLKALSLNVQSGGIITADGLGYAGGKGPGAGSNNDGFNNWAVGASHGGYGHGSAGSASVYGDVYNPDMMGSGSGVDGGSVAGGGAIKIETPSLTLNGEISADGLKSTNSRNTGSSAGSIWIETTTINGAGTGVISTDGKDSVYEARGSGGGGRIAISYETDNWGIPSEIGDGIHAYGGSGSGYNGGAGTIYVEETDVHSPQAGDLYVDNRSASGQYAALLEDAYEFNVITLSRNGYLRVNGTGSDLTISNESGIQGDATPILLTYGILRLPDTFSFSGVNVRIWGDLYSLVDASDTSNMNITVANTGKLDLYSGAWGSIGGLYEFDTVDVDSGGYIYMTGYDNGNTCNSTDDPGCYDDYGVTLSANQITIDSGGIVSADGLGYGGGKGPGCGSNFNGTGAWAVGASHGGYGHGSAGSAAVYGDVYEPSMMGSGSGIDGGSVAGGGSIKIETPALTLNGEITADGLRATNSRNTGSSAGSVWIEATTINGGGTGVISADGRESTSEYKASGGGGRIAIYYETDNWGLASEIGDGIHAYGGSEGGYNGGPGTVYLEETDVHTSHAGNLYVDNRNVNGRYAALLEDSYEFNVITLSRYGYLQVNGTGSVLTISNESGILGDTTPSLLTYGVLKLPDTFTMSGVNVRIWGDLHSLVYGTDTSNMNFTIADTGKLDLYAGAWGSTNGLYEFDILSVDTGGYLYLTGYDNGNTCDSSDDPGCYDDYGVTLTANTITVDSGGYISADGLGYVGGKGPGVGSNFDGTGFWGIGSAHGGYGYGTYGTASVYGDAYEPIMMGSGSGVDGGSVPGGGALKIEATTLTVDGEISADGILAPSARNTGSTGGSVLIQVTTLNGSGSGVISADGRECPDAWDSVASGGGGRIAVYYETDNWGIPSEVGDGLHAYGGAVQDLNAGAGTIYLEETDVHSAQAGNLYVDNRNVNGAEAALLEGDYEFNQISMTRYGHLKVLGEGTGCDDPQYETKDDCETNGGTWDGGTTLTLSSSSGYVGDSTQPDLTIYGTLNYTGTGTLGINGVDVGLNGDFIGQADFELGTLGASYPGGLTVYAHTWARTGTYTFGDVHVGADGTMSLVGYDNGNTCDSTDDPGCYDDYGVTLITDDITVDSGGHITADGLGYTGGKGPGAGSNHVGQIWAVGASHGGYGHGSEGNASTYGDVHEPAIMGSGSGIDGGSVGGGGSIRIQTSTLTLDGELSADGLNATTSRNTGSTGGSLWVEATTINGSGTGVISADGGAGISEFLASSGGGRIAIYFETDNWGLASELEDGLHAYGGSAGGYNAGPGTIYLEETDVHDNHAGDLLVTNRGVNGKNASLSEGDYEFNQIELTGYGHLQVEGTNSTLTISSESGLDGDETPMLLTYGILEIPDTFTVSGVNARIWGDLYSISDGADTSNMNLTISGTGKLDLYAGAWGSTNGLYEFDTVDVDTGGYMYLTGYDNGNTCNSTDDPGCYDDYGATLRADEITVSTGAYISADGLGYVGGKGPGAGWNDATGLEWGAIGASHGGYGHGTDGSADTYGDIYEPVLMGSGSGTDGSYVVIDGVGGGGAIKIEASVLNIDGKISADGRVVTTGRNTGSSAGSVWINATTINGNGSGVISADGKPSISEFAGSGGGGRVAIYYQTDNWGLPTEVGDGLHAYGGNGGGYIGGPGSVYLEETDVHTSQAGNLYIDNDSGVSSGSYTDDFQAQEYTFHDVLFGTNTKARIYGDTSEDAGIYFNLTGDFTLGTGGRLEGNSHGFLSGLGQGAGQEGPGSNGGSGAGHGGAGGEGQTDGVNPNTPSGPIYDSAILPLYLGSGGGPGGNGGAGGTGGGAFAVGGDPGTLTIDGTIDMSAGNGIDDGTSSGGGGSGGSIYLKGCDIYISASALLDVSGGNSPPSTFQGGGGGGGIISLAHTCTDTIDIEDLGSIDYSEGTGYQDGGEGVFTMYGAPSMLSTNQFNYEDLTIISVGDVIDDRHVRIRAWVTDADAEDVLTMEVELKPAGQNIPFNNSGVVHSDPVEWTLGDPIVMEVIFTDAWLEVGGAYKWRIRIRDDSGAVSPWYDFADNGDLADFIIADEWAPLVPWNLGQFKSNGSTSIPVGGTTDETTVVLKATLDTAPFIGSLIPEFEVRPIGVDFLNSATHVGELESWLVGNVIGSVTVTGLTNNTNYHWQMRTCNGLDVCSVWVPFGGNAESEVDFGVLLPTGGGEEQVPGEEGEDEETEQIEELPGSGEEGEGGAIDDIEEIVEKIYTRFETITIWWWLMLLIFLVGLISILKQYGFALVDLPYFLQRLRLSTLYTLGWKSEGDPWGIVYDSVSKELLGRCVVRLYDLQNELVDTSVTDTSGVFNFEPRSGTYQLEVSRSGYYFPSTVITGTMDGVRKNVYHGEPYEVAGDKEPVRVYVPMDNESGAGLKRLFIKITSFLVGLFMVLSPFLLVIGMILSYVYWVRTEDWFNLIMLFGYLVMLGLLVYGWLRERGNWGTVVDIGLEPVPGVTVGLYDPTYNRLIDTRVSDSKGRFRFVVPGGEYIVRVEGTEYVLAEPGYEAGYVVGTDTEGDQQITERVVVRSVKG